MTPEQRDKRDKADLHALLKQPEFLRFLWRVIQRARIFDRTADGSDGDTSLGRRNLGLEILEMVEAGQPAQHPDQIPVLTIIQTLREEAIQQPGDKDNDPGSKQRYDRNADLGNDGDD